MTAHFIMTTSLTTSFFLTASLAVLGLSGCQPKSDAPVKSPTTTVSTPAATPAPQGFQAEDFGRNRNGGSVKGSDFIDVQADRVVLTTTKNGPSLSLSALSPIEGELPYFLTVDIDPGQISDDLAIRALAWPVDAAGKIIDLKSYAVMGQAVDLSAGRQTLKFRFGAPGTDQGRVLTPPAGATQIRFEILPLTDAVGTKLTIHEMSANRG